MDRRDVLVLLGIIVGTGTPLTLVMLIANGILDNPIP